MQNSKTIYTTSKKSHQAVSNQLEETRDEKNKIIHNLLFPAVGLTCLFFIILVISLFIGRKKKVVKTIQNEPQTISSSAIHNLVGTTDLLLQRGRTGDDLILLKAMERELQKLWNQSTTENNYPATVIDDDRVIRALKGIRILVYSDNSDSSFLLKNWLRKQIRLCDVQTSESIETLPQNFQPYAIVYDAEIISNETLQQLQSLFANVPVVLSVARKDNTGTLITLQKPYGLNLLLDELIKVYTPQDEPRVVETKANVVTADSQIQFYSEKLEQAYTAKNGDALVEACNGLFPLFEKANSPAIKWLKLLIDPPENVSDVQIELAYRNVITYCRSYKA